MRRVAFIVVAVVLVAVVGVSAFAALRGRGDEGVQICRGLDRELELALSNPPKPDDRDELIEIGHGFCNVAKTSKLDLHLPGVAEQHRETFIRGHLSSDPSQRPAAQLRRERRYVEEDEKGGRIVPVPALGPDAFAVIARNADPAAPVETLDPGVSAVSSTDEAADPEATPVSPYLVTVHWWRDRTVLAASATRVGADAAEVRRVSIRFAELINRRPIAHTTFADDILEP